jgi:transcriptional regulator with XRE-family HTH domain
MTATSAAAMVVPAGLRCIRQDLDLEQRHAAAHLGVSTAALLRWEKGRENPRTHHMLAYAALLNRRLMVGRGGVGRYELEYLLPNLAVFRRAHRLTQQQVADRMHVTFRAVSSLEGKVRRGEPIGWDLLVRYLAALGYQVSVARAEVTAA